MKTHLFIHFLCDPTAIESFSEPAQVFELLDIIKKKNKLKDKFYFRIGKDRQMISHTLNTIDVWVYQECGKFVTPLGCHTCCLFCEAFNFITTVTICIIQNSSVLWSVVLCELCLSQKALIVPYLNKCICTLFKKKIDKTNTFQTYLTFHFSINLYCIVHIRKFPEIFDLIAKGVVVNAWVDLSVNETIRPINLKKCKRSYFMPIYSK